MTREQIGLQMAELRKICGMSQQELADASGMSRWSITQFETGKQTISVDKLLRMCDALGVEMCIKEKSE